MGNIILSVFAVLLLPLAGFCDCELPSLLIALRPDANWNVRGGVIEWLDPVQVQPTSQELQTALTSCRDNLTPTGVLLKQRALAINELNIDPSGNAKVIRAILLTALDEINILRQRDRDRAIDVAASTSLADLKTRWSARPALADRTVEQGKTSVQNKINSGEPD